ncbi:PREDICTED: 14-3-3-like protein [Nicotiana attenuata]|uniref:14-3-3-like protein n=1 Tax=Nicotiana attenuata TaxID=49451 RepID=UPI00090542AF|nr:PREDICTED: 14-3-3-like protein [Nicotiana attenuata]
MILDSDGSRFGDKYPISPGGRDRTEVGGYAGLGERGQGGQEASRFWRYSGTPAPVVTRHGRGYVSRPVLSVLPVSSGTTATSRVSWRIISSIEQKEESNGNENNVKLINGYRRKVIEELSKTCLDILEITDKHRIP